jgi:hypothetical protein
MRDGAGAFYRAAGFQEELREQVATAAKAAFDDYVDAVVPTIFAQADTDTDRMLSKEEFLHWVRRHPQALSWLENFATFVLSSVAVSDGRGPFSTVGWTILFFRKTAFPPASLQCIYHASCH